MLAKFCYSTEQQTSPSNRDFHSAASQLWTVILLHYNTDGHVCSLRAL